VARPYVLEQVLVERAPLQLLQHSAHPVLLAIGLQAQLQRPWRAGIVPGSALLEGGRSGRRSSAGQVLPPPPLAQGSHHWLRRLAGTACSAGTPGGGDTRRQQCSPSEGQALTGALTVAEQKEAREAGRTQALET